MKLENSKCMYCHKLHSVYNPCRGMKTADAMHRSASLEPGDYFRKESYGQRLQDGFNLAGASGDRNNRYD